MTAPQQALSPLPEPAWGPLLAAYIVLVGLPSGVTLTTWWLGRQRLAGAVAAERYGAWGSLGLLVLISLILVVDLGRPERFSLMLTSFDNLGSPIALGAKLIAVKMFLLAVLVYGFERRRLLGTAADSAAAGQRTGSLLVWSLVFVSFGLALYPAALLRGSWASPLAGGSGSALLFLLTALLMGAAVLLLVVAGLGSEQDGAWELLHAARRALLLLIGCFAIALLFEVLSLAGRPPDRLLAGELLTGGMATLFWGVVVVGGIALPAAGLLLLRTRRAAVFLSAAAVLVGAAATRYLIFAVGQ